MFATDELAGANLVEVRAGELWKQRMDEYVRDRLREEIEKGGYGAKAKMARKLGLKPGSLTPYLKLPGTKGFKHSGIDTWLLAMGYWGLSTLGDLERAAFGRGPTSELSEAAREAMRARPGAGPEARAALAAYRGPELTLEGYTGLLDGVETIVAGLRSRHAAPADEADPPKKTMTRAIRR